MAIDDLPWRKFPRDAISNVKIRFIQKQLPSHLKHCALLFFTTAYCLADDYGAVDLEDGLVFADAMDIDNPGDIFLIAEHFAARGVMEKINERVYVISDWDMPNRDRQYRTPLTAEQRREAVKSRLKAESPEEKPPPVSGKSAQKKKDVATKSKKMSLHGECSDKKRESVATQRERQTGERGQTDQTDKTDTHTQQTAALAHAALSAHGAPCGGTQAAAQPESGEPRKETKEEPDRGKHTEYTELQRQGQSLESENLGTEKKNAASEGNNEVVKTPTVGKGRTDRAGGLCYLDDIPSYVATVDVLSDFFLKNNPKGYPDRQNEQNSIIKLAQRIVILRDKDNTAEIIAANFCRCFKKLTEQHQYYKDMALLPSNLLKPGAFSVVFGEVGRILKPKGVDWQKKYDKMVVESLEDREVYGDTGGNDGEYKKYGITPDDPERFIKLLHAQKAAAREKNTQEYVNDS